MTEEQVRRHLRSAQAVADAAQAAGHHPFGALLVGPDDETVLMTQGNVDTVRHAESELARAAAQRYTPDELWRSTLVTTVEPCAMCTATAYWAHIGRIVYGADESELRAITGAHAENPTLDLPCRDVLARGQKAVEVVGPVPGLAEDILAVHRDFWAARG
ncbi:MAG: nucleoside deaminase [Rubrivivax sp.]|jgi:tRNA(Arg) A34 adenosine deaminase TadA|nr:nucleoside deaminase [Rubrivivax sp.]